MADDPALRGPADATRINVNEDYELRYWCDKLGCSPTELRKAVRSVGVMVRNVDAHLKKQFDGSAQ